MILAIIVLAAQVGRTGPIEVPSSMRELAFSTRESGGSRTQYGRIQVVPWVAFSNQSKDELAVRLKDWTRPSKQEHRFVRQVGSILQTITLYDHDREPGLRTRVVLAEAPPPDGSVPGDWPADFKKGIYRVLPAMVVVLKDIEPAVISTSRSPAGNGAEALYTINGTIDTVVKALREQFPLWTQEGATREVRLYPKDTSTTARVLTGITVSDAQGPVTVTVRWLAGRYDRTDSRPNLPSTIDAKPIAKMPEVLGNRFGRASVLDFGTFGGKALSWRFTVQVSSPKLFEALNQAKVATDGLFRANVFRFTLASPNSYLEAGVIEGREELRRAAPDGWRPTAEFAGFLDPVIVDPDKVCTVSITERRRRIDGPWPKAALYTWPISKLGTPPIPEMSVQPEYINFPVGGEGGYYATWTVTPTETRVRELLALSYAPSPSDVLRRLSITRLDASRIRIVAEYPMQ